MFAYKTYCTILPIPIVVTKPTSARLRTRSLCSSECTSRLLTPLPLLLLGAAVVFAISASTGPSSTEGVTRLCTSLAGDSLFVSSLSSRRLRTLLLRGDVRVLRGEGATIVARGEQWSVGGLLFVDEVPTRGGWPPLCGGGVGGCLDWREEGRGAEETQCAQGLYELSPRWKRNWLWK